MSHKPRPPGDFSLPTDGEVTGWSQLEHAVAGAEDGGSTDVAPRSSVLKDDDKFVGCEGGGGRHSRQKEEQKQEDTVVLGHDQKARRFGRGSTSDFKEVVWDHGKEAGL